MTTTFDGQTYHVHEHIGQHAHADLVVSPCLLQALEELLARNAPLVGRSAAQPLRIRQQVWREERLYLGADVGAEPGVLKVADAFVQLLALLLQDQAVGVAVELLVREPRCVLGVDFAEGGRYCVPCLLEVNIVAADALVQRYAVSLRLRMIVQLLTLRGGRMRCLPRPAIMAAL
jgi:hypothetical protein